MAVNIQRIEDGLPIDNREMLISTALSVFYPVCRDINELRYLVNACCFFMNQEPYVPIFFTHAQTSCSIRRLQRECQDVLPGAQSVWKLYGPILNDAVQSIYRRIENSVEMER